MFDNDIFILAQIIKISNTFLNTIFIYFLQQIVVFYLLIHEKMYVVINTTII